MKTKVEENGTGTGPRPGRREIAFEFAAAVPEEAEQVLVLIRERIGWMDRQGIRQWNTTGYLEYYPGSYFRECAEKGELFVLRMFAGGTGGSLSGTAGVISGEPFPRIAGAVALHTADRWWPQSGDALYIHNLVASVEVPGAGDRLLQECERLARNRGKRFLRLDCQKGNDRLNRYYRERGYVYRGTMTAGAYTGNKLEKVLDPISLPVRRDFI